MTEKRGFHLTPMKKNPLDVLPIGAIYGELGSGKTTETLRAFSDYTWIVTRKSQLLGPASWIAANPEQAKELGIAMPKRVMSIVDGRDADGNSTTDWEAWIRGFADLVKTRPGNYVLDEATTLFRWAYATICGRIRSGGRGAFDRVDAIKELAQHLLQNTKESECGAIWLCHFNERKLHEEGVNKGSMKYSEGPNFPIGTMIRELMLDFDFVWKIQIDGSGDQAQRSLLCHPAEGEVRKTARHGAAQREELDIHKLLTRLGYRLNSNQPAKG